MVSSGAFKRSQKQWHVDKSPSPVALSSCQSPAHELRDAGEMELVYPPFSPSIGNRIGSDIVPRSLSSNYITPLAVGWSALFFSSLHPNHAARFNPLLSQRFRLSNRPGSCFVLHSFICETSLLAKAAETHMGVLIALKYHQPVSETQNWEMWWWCLCQVYKKKKESGIRS